MNPVISFAPQARVKLITLATYFILLFGPGFTRAENFYRLIPESLGKNEISSLQNFLNQAESFLPQSLKGEFPQGIEVQFSLKGLSHGKALIRSRAAKMLLNEKLISAIMAGEKNSAPSLDEKGEVRIHKTVYREALGTVLHETAHLYDYLNLQTPEMKYRINWCANISYDDQAMQKECAIYKAIKSTISTNPYYLEAAGWPMMTNGNGTRVPENLFKFRSPDVYEFENSQEHFAVNFEYFLLDSSYACRRPTLARFFSSHFQMKGPVCAVNYRYVDPDAVDIQNLFKQIPVDRIYQVHYLLADSGTAPMSRFGHSMLRLVICAPGQPKGPQCLEDNLDHSLVLSFRAFIGTPQINSIAGLTGQYPSRLFVVPMQDVIEEYNEVEYRSLKSYPLNLSEQEIKNLVERALETHWSYDSRYYFTTNNCATETLNLLKSSLLRPELIDKLSIYPKDLLTLLQREKLVTDLPKNKDQALKQGYYFDSRQVQHLQSYNLFFDKKADQEELQKFFDLPIEKRQELYSQRFNELKGVMTEKTPISAFQLELHSLKVNKSQFRSDVISHIWVSKNQNVTESYKGLNLSDVYKNAVAAFGSLSAPYQILKLTDYGIPSFQEMTESEKKVSEVKVQIQTAREVEAEIKMKLEDNSFYKEISKIKKLISKILEIEP